MPFVALALSLLLAWINFAFTGKWASLPGALHGWRLPYYGVVLTVATVLAILSRRRVGHPVRIGRAAALGVLGAGAGLLAAALLSRLPVSSWNQLLFKAACDRSSS